MNTFTMEMEHVDSETGEMVTETIVIDDVEFHSAGPFQPEPDYSNDDCPW